MQKGISGPPSFLTHLIFIALIVLILFMVASYVFQGFAGGTSCLARFDSDVSRLLQDVYTTYGSATTYKYFKVDDCIRDFYIDQTYAGDRKDCDKAWGECKSWDRKKPECNSYMTFWRACIQLNCASKCLDGSYTCFNFERDVCEGLTSYYPYITSRICYTYIENVDGTKNCQTPVITTPIFFENCGDANNKLPPGNYLVKISQNKVECVR